MLKLYRIRGRQLSISDILLIVTLFIGTCLVMFKAIAPHDNDNARWFLQGMFLMWAICGWWDNVKRRKSDLLPDDNLWTGEPDSYKKARGCVTDDLISKEDFLAAQVMTGDDWKEKLSGLPHSAVNDVILGRCSMMPVTDVTVNRKV